MNTSHASPFPASLADWLSQLIFAFLSAIFVFLGGLLIFAIGYGAAYSGRVFPGVQVAGIDLSGSTPEEAVTLLQVQFTYPTNGKIAFQDGDKFWLAAPKDLGLYLDAQASVQAAYDIGRRGGAGARVTEQFSVWLQPVNLAPQIVFDERVAQAHLSKLAAEVNRPTVEATLRVEGREVIVQPGQVGRSVDIPVTLANLRAQLQTSRDGIVPLVIPEQAPVILDVTEQAEIARKILSAPLIITVPDAAEGDPGPWTLEPDALAAMLIIERVTTPDGLEHYQIGLNSERLRALLETAAPDLARNSQDARFTFNDETKQLELIQPAIIGRTLLIDESIQAINQQAAAGEHRVKLVFDYTQPAVTDDATAESLGVRELVASHTTYFYGSSAARIQNISTASGRFHGVLVAPGAVFSMAEILGDVSLDNGYAEALIIYGDRTIKGVGGGVCQVSTTLFRTVFFGGFPINERYSHAYRVSYYEFNADGSTNPRLAGLDATVFVPYVDFKFTNDTENWLLMETYVNSAARTLTWKFYSTSDGRNVDWTTTGPQNIEQPPAPRYQENPQLARGEIKQVDWAAEGADVTVTRTVYRGGSVYFNDSFSTHYLPWRAVYEYGPGTKIPKDDPKKKDRDE